MIDLFSGTTFWTILCIGLSTLYWIYYRKFRIFIYDQPEKVVKGKTIRGQCPPAYPNGWFWLVDSCNLKAGDVKFVNHAGRDVVVFRGWNGQVYVLEAYCAHIGGNLGIGGKVRDINCIECPFHGWIYDGATGQCVFSDGENRTVRKLDRLMYHDIKRCTPVLSTETSSVEYIEKLAVQQEVQLKRYECREVNGSIFAWYHADERFHHQPLYEIFDLKDEIERNGMEVRGESINYVNCHIQEIPENGSDLRHFDLIHSSILDWIPFIKFKWSLLAERAAHPDLRKIMAHPHPQANAYKMGLFDKFLNEKNQRYINIMSLDCSIRFFDKHDLYLFNTTGFQLGPSTVYLFLWSPYFKLTFFHTLTPLEKFHQRVVHRIITSSWMPYWLSSLMLMGEVKQLYADMKVWNHKIFTEKIHFNLKNLADQYLYGYRNWYAQFYEGCYERESKSLEW